MYTHAILLFLSSFFVVFLLGLQSKNVNGNHYVLAALTSTGIGLCNLYVIRAVSIKELSDLALIGYIAGGPIGIVFSMWVHDKFVRPKRV
jgi:hypothetical protein